MGKNMVSLKKKTSISTSHHTKTTNSGWTTHVKLKAKTTKLLEKNIKYLYHMGLKSHVLKIQRAIIIKEKVVSTPHI